jgi:dTDP-4-dehydrorhamnose 3,5-epimerase
VNVQATAMAGLYVLKPRRFSDDRGWFEETWNAGALASAGIATVWKQDNHSLSLRKGTLRGLHYQAPPMAQDKLVRCSRGLIYDVAVDIRVGSSTYMQSFGIELSPENGLQLLIPKGFLHGFVTLSDASEVQYKCSETYAAACDRSVAWNDPDLAVNWQGIAQPILSAKDAAAPRLRDAASPFTFGAAL